MTIPKERIGDKGQRYEVLGRRRTNGEWVSIGWTEAMDGGGLAQGVALNPGFDDLCVVERRPILFSGEMVRAILDGRKTQTRRVVKPQPVQSPSGTAWSWKLTAWTDACRGQISDLSPLDKCPFGVPGDRLWVRETWRPEELSKDGDLSAFEDGIRYRADRSFRTIENTREAADAWVRVNDHTDRWRPSIHMPRWASRIELEVTEVRVERLQEISSHDALEEGIELYGGCTSNEDMQGWDPCEHFASGWDGLNAKRGFGWDTNPWVWVVEFRRLER